MLDGAGVAGIDAQLNNSSAHTITTRKLLSGWFTTRPGYNLFSRRARVGFDFFKSVIVVRKMLAFSKYDTFFVVVLSPPDHIIPLWDNDCPGRAQYRIHQISLDKTRLN